MKRLSAPAGLLVLCIAGFAASTAVAQEASVYKWVDAEGVPHFSDQPPLDSSAEELALWCDNWDAVPAARGFMNILVGAAG